MLPENCSDEVVKTFTLEAISCDPPSKDILHRLNEISVEMPDSSFTRFWNSTKDSQPIEEVGKERPLGPLPTLLDLVSKSPNPDVARTVLITADTIGTLESFGLAINSVEKLSEEDQATLFSTKWIRELKRSIFEALGGSNSAKNWKQWVTLCEEPDFITALQVASQGSQQWSVKDHLSDPQQVNELVEAIEGVTGDLALQRLQEALPLLVEWVYGDDSFPNPRLIPLYKTILDLFVLGSSRSANELISAGYLVEALLVCGVDVESYKDLIDAILELTGESSGTRVVDWMLDMVELTIANQTPDDQERQRLWAGVCGKLLPISARLSGMQREVLQLLSGTMGLENDSSFNSLVASVETTEQPRSTLSRLSGLKVGIYTLTDSAAKQAAEIIKRYAPGVKVTLNHEHDGSPQLKAFARNADVLVDRKSVV